MKKIVFVSGTRADFAKIKSLMEKIEASPHFELYIFATGMHLSKKFGLTVREIEKAGFCNIYRFINHDKFYQMDLALASTIDGFSKFIAEYEPDLIVVHGDRVEPLAASIVGALHNILVAHIEGGEVSGTIDDSLRHAISKLAHIHFVNDEQAKQRLLQLGEKEEAIFIIGSPDLDALESQAISLDEAKRYYEIPFLQYGIVMFHPVTTESMGEQARIFTQALQESKHNYIVIYPNNDMGFEAILDAYEALRKDAHFVLFPSIRFEYFLALLKGARFAIGNSSALLKEAPYLGIPSIVLGSRQHNRTGLELDTVMSVPMDKDAILQAIIKATQYKASQAFSASTSLAQGITPSLHHANALALTDSPTLASSNAFYALANQSITPFNHSHMPQSRKKSNECFYEILCSGALFNIPTQKTFMDRA